MKGKNSPMYDQNISKVREAIRLCVEGSSMSQASLNMGFNQGWLSCWKFKHPERFRQIYMEEANDFDQKMSGKVHK